MSIKIRYDVAADIRGGSALGPERHIHENAQELSMRRSVSLEPSPFQPFNDSGYFEPIEKRLTLWSKVQELSSRIASSIEDPSMFSQGFKEDIKRISAEIDLAKEAPTRHCFTRVLGGIRLSERTVHSPEILLLHRCPTSEIEKRTEVFFLEENREGYIHMLQKKVQNLDRARQILEYPYSRNPRNIPQKTQAIARAFIAGENPITIERDAPLGSGAEAVVYRGSVLGLPCAAKMYKGSMDFEYDNLMRLKHKNIIPIYATDGRSLFEPLAEGGNLQEYWEGNNPMKIFTPEQVLEVLCQISDALVYIHKKGCVYRDLKPENVLVHKDGTVQLADLGTVTKAKIVAKYPHHTAGTILYLPPEAISGRSKIESCKKIDVWSLGMLVWRLLHKDGIEHPSLATIQGRYSLVKALGEATQYTRGELLDQLDQDKRQKYDPNRFLVDLIEKCLTHDPQQRPGMREIHGTLKAEVMEMRRARESRSSRFPKEEFAFDLSHAMPGFL
ncbi:MAG: serine/threonine-protein kinase [Anaplasmataceae bacterium]|nr:serine/threonine-protein kinase [Anaplasmataceae bacterium]